MSPQTWPKTLPSDDTPERHGAVGQNISLGSYFPSLLVAQMRYPFVTSLNQTVDWAAWQDAFNSIPAAGGEIIGQTATTYFLSDEVNPPLGKPFNVKASNWSTTLLWSTDLGSAKWGIKSRDPFGNWVNGIDCYFLGLHLVGPDGTGSPTQAQLDTVSAQMRSIDCERRWHMMDCKVEGFYSTSIYGNHQSFWRNTLRNNFYGLEYRGLTAADPMIGSSLGDQHLIQNFLTGNRRAGVGIGDRVGFITTLFSRNHWGFQPWCIYVEGITTNGQARASGTIFTTCIFQGNDWEQYGNGWLFSEDANQNNDVIRRCAFLVDNGVISGAGTPSAAFNSTYKALTRVSDFACRIGTIEYTRIIGQFNPLCFPGDVGVLQMAQMRNNRWMGAELLIDQIAALARPFITAISAANNIEMMSNHIEAYGVTYHPGNPDNTVVPGDSLERIGTINRCRKYVSGIFCGIAAENGAEVTGLERILIAAVGGPVTANTQAAVTAFSYMWPDTVNNGKLTSTNPGTNTPPIVAQSTGANTGAPGTTPVILLGV